MGPFTALASQLLEQCKQLDAHLDSSRSNVAGKNVSPLESEIFDEDLLQDLPPSLQNVRSSVVYTAQRLADLTCEPKDHISRIIYSVGPILPQ